MIHQFVISDISGCISGCENKEAPYSNEESTPQTRPFSREIAAHARSSAMFRLRHVLIQSGQPLPVLVERLEGKISGEVAVFGW